MIQESWLSASPCSILRCVSCALCCGPSSIRKARVLAIFRIKPFFTALVDEPPKTFFYKTAGHRTQGLKGNPRTYPVESSVVHVEVFAVGIFLSGADVATILLKSQAALALLPFFFQILRPHGQQNILLFHFSPLYSLLLICSRQRSL